MDFPRSRESQFLLSIVQRAIAVPPTYGDIPRDLDWVALVALADKHALVPFLAWYLRDHPEMAAAVPHSWQLHLQATFKANALRNLSLTAELGRLLQQAEIRQIAAIAIKGPLLSQLAYGDVAVRRFLDLDVLVLEEHYLRFAMLLQEYGYEPMHDFAPTQRSLYLKLRNELCFRHPVKHITIDVHWAILPRHFSFSPTAAMAWQNCEWQLLGNRRVGTLSREHLLLYLCAHGTKHDWAQLNWIVDIAALLQRSPAMDWDYILATTGKFGTPRMLRLGLTLARELCGSVLPEPVDRFIDSDPILPSLVHQAERHLFAIAASTAPLKKRIYPIAMERWRDRGWYYVDAIATPAEVELLSVRFPTWLFFCITPGGCCGCPGSMASVF